MRKSFDGVRELQMINLDTVVTTGNLLLLGSMRLSDQWPIAFLLTEVQPCGFVLLLACTIYCENLFKQVCVFLIMSNGLNYTLWTQLQNHL